MCKISVITINLNNLKGLKRTVESVISQTCRDFEYIVIDGASTDGSKEYIGTIGRINYWVSEPDKGIYNAMNKAVAVAKGEYCIFMNSGDCFYNDRVLEDMCSVLKGKDFYTGHPVLVYDDRMEKVKLPKSISISFMLIGSIYHQCTFTRTAILKERPYNEQHRLVSDWEYFFKEWLLFNRSYEVLDTLIAYFYMDGLSNTNKELDDCERAEVVKDIFTELYYREEHEVVIRVDSCQNGDKNLLAFRRKMKKAEMLSPIARDLKILRNAFKLFWKDIIDSICKK